MRHWLRCVAVIGAALGAVVAPSLPALAWRPEAHKVVAILADRLLQQSDAAVRAKVQAIVAGDTEKRRGRPAPGIADQAIWPDELRERSQEARVATSGWHYVRLKYDNPDLTRDCFGRKPLPVGYPASHGPRDNCAIDKIEQFAKELADPATGAGERLMALRFVLNLVGDLHQPLYAIDRGDRGGYCVALVVGSKPPVRLSDYWDRTLAGDVIGRDPARAAGQIGAGISAADIAKWSAGDPETWARESYEIAKSGA